MKSTARRSHSSTRIAQLAVANLFVAASVQAGLVNWSSPQTITGDGDVSTSGTLVVAHNLGTFGNASTTVNGVTFTPFVTSAASNTVGNVTLSASSTIFGNNSDFGDEFAPPFATLSEDYKKLLRSGSFTSAATFPPPTISMSLNGLTPGTEYQFQWWAHESEPSSFAPAPGIPATTATSGNSVTLDRRGFVEGSTGQFALGLFTATSASQSITFDGSDTKTLLSAFQLREISASTVPEPGTALFGIALAGLALCSPSRRR